MKSESPSWKKVSRETIYAAKHEDDVSIFKDRAIAPDGNVIDYVFLHSPYDVAVVAVEDEAGRIGVLRHYRYLFDEVLMELPSGSPSSGETIVEGVRREVEEELGVSVADVDCVAELYSSVGITDQRFYIFVAKAAAQVVGFQKEAEIVEVEWLSKKELLLCVLTGKVRNALSATSILYLNTVSWKIDLLAGDL